MTARPELTAAYWTLAGDIHPDGPTEVSPFPVEERVKAAADAGFVGIGFTASDVRASVERLGWASLRRLLGDYGMRHVEVEYLGDWFVSGEKRVASDAKRAQMLEAAAELGARQIKLSPGLPETLGHPTEQERHPDFDQIAEEFAALCDEAAQAGTTAVIEVMPHGILRTPAQGVEVIRRAVGASADEQALRRFNGGLLIDIWHIARDEIAYDRLRALPAGIVKWAEIDDAAGKRHGTMWDDTNLHRLLPGEGDLHPRHFIAAMQDAGYHGPWGVEVLSEQFRTRPLTDMARLAFTMGRAQFADHGPAS